MIEMFVFDAIIGNTDRHQENWAIINRKGEISISDNSRLAPIYDNGTSLGRELTDKAIAELVKNDKKLKVDYVLKGEYEIHWNGHKINHFDFLKNISQLAHYHDTVVNSIKRAIELYSPIMVEEIISNIDNKIPDSHSEYKIPENRKRLITKLLTLRIEELKKLIHERV